jgi:anti-sigma B factor antagonist
LPGARLDIDVIDRGGTLIVRPVGWLVAENYRSLEEKLERLLASGRVRVILDLSVAHVVASPLLGVLVYYSEQLAAEGGALVVGGPLRSVRRMIAASGLEGKLTIYESAAEALKLMSAEDGDGDPPGGGDR